MSKTFGPIGEKGLWPGASENLHQFTQRYEKLVPSRDPKKLAGPFPHTVVLHGPAGLGETTLAKKWMLDWTQGNAPGTPGATFYLSCRELGRQRACTLEELIAERCPGAPGASAILAQGRKVLFVVGGFDELRVPSGSLIRDTCGAWRRQKPVPSCWAAC